MRTRNVKEFGATGNGTTLDTVAIQTAIDAGGLVYFPPGVYLSGTLYLRSNGGLELSPGAILRGSPNLADYNPADFVPQNSASKAEVTSGGHLIAAVECSNIVLCGGGTIDGNHPAFLNETDPECPLMYRRIARPGQMVFLCECTDVRIQDLNLKNAPYWTCFLHGCEEVTIHGLHIQSDPRVLNDDGIDLDCCRRVTVSDCIISTGDDALTLRGNNSRLKQKRDCCEIVVTNCILESHYANAIRVGVGCGEIHDALFENIIVPGYRTAISLVSNWSNDPASCVGAEIHDIEFRNIRSHARRFLQIKLDNAPEGNAHTSGARTENPRATKPFLPCNVMQRSIPSTRRAAQSGSPSMRQRVSSIVPALIAQSSIPVPQPQGFGRLASTSARHGRCAKRCAGSREVT